MSPSLESFNFLKCAELCSQVYKEGSNWIYEYKSEQKILYIAIRGTSSIGDWKKNLSFLFKHEDTHDGFKRNAWSIAIDILLSGVMKEIQKDCQIILAGHSLGGATAVVLLDLLQNYYKNIAVVTFGAPRPGGRMLRKRLSAQVHYRFVYGSDIVPFTPPVAHGYVHTHPSIILSDLESKAFDFVDDHFMDRYMRALQMHLGNILA